MVKVAVDLKYVKHLHDLHNDFPFCPENGKVGKVTKLIPNLNDKENYPFHYKTLLFCLDQGMELTKVHRAITFKKSAWMKPYIDLNTKIRTQATNEFEKRYFKKMVNAAYGKTLENVRNHAR